MDKVGVGVIGCGNISGTYLTAARLFPRIDVRAVADQNPAAAEARGAEFGVEARRIADAPRRSGDRDRAQPDDPGGPRRGQPSGDLRRQARLLREAARRHLRRGPRHRRRRRRAGPARRLRARHLPRRRAPGRRASWSTPARSAPRSAAPPSSCARATSAGTRTPTSTTRSAAGRSSTSGPTTSPTSSTCSARSSASPPSPACRTPTRLVTSRRPAARTRNRGRGPDPHPRPPRVRQRRRRHARRQLRRLRATATADRGLRHRRHARRPRSQLVRRRGRVSRRAASGRQSGRPPPLDRGQLCARSASPTWRRRSARIARTARRASWRCTCSR